ncbi:MAG: hypothetical protein V4481_00125 [Patescibacteria group bacterium]
METIQHADTFFFVSTIGFVVLGVLLVIALFYLIKVLANLRHITDRVRSMSDRAQKEGDFFFTELHELSERMRSRTFNIFSLIWFIKRIIRKYI